MNFKAALFDLDGTLLDTLDDIADAMNGALAALGFPAWPTAQYRDFVGMGLEQLAERVLPADRRTGRDIAACLAAMRRIYAESWSHRTAPYKGIPEALLALRERGIRCAVLSNKAHAFVLTMVNHYFGEATFDVVLGGGRFPLKPDPAGALSIAASTGIAPSAFVFVGDSDVDMKTAGAAGMFAIGAAWGFRTREELLANGARVLAETPADIVTAISG
jgi:phosphoglycolate phosphatase